MRWTNQSDGGMGGGEGKQHCWFEGDGRVGDLIDFLIYLRKGCRQDLRNVAFSFFFCVSVWLLYDARARRSITGPVVMRKRGRLCYTVFLEELKVSGLGYRIELLIAWVMRKENMLYYLSLRVESLRYKVQNRARYCKRNEKKKIVLHPLSLRAEGLRSRV